MRGQDHSAPAGAPPVRRRGHPARPDGRLGVPRLHLRHAVPQAMLRRVPTGVGTGADQGAGTQRRRRGQGPGPRQRLGRVPGSLLRAAAGPLVAGPARRSGAPRRPGPRHLTPHQQGRRGTRPGADRSPGRQRHARRRRHAHPLQRRRRQQTPVHQPGAAHAHPSLRDVPAPQRRLRVPRHARRRVRVPDRSVRRLGRPARRRVLHAARRGPDDGATGRPAAQRDRVRPVHGLGGHADRGEGTRRGPRRRPRHAAARRPGQERPVVVHGQDESDAARHPGVRAPPRRHPYRAAAPDAGGPAAHVRQGAVEPPVLAELRPGGRGRG